MSDNTDVSVGAKANYYILSKGYEQGLGDIPANSSMTYRLTATSAERYTFGIYDCDYSIVAELKDANGNVIDKGQSDPESENYSISLGADLVSGQVVYLTIYNNGYDDDSLEANIYSSKSYTITLDSSVTASLSYCGKNYFYFTPEESGYYKFTVDSEEVSGEVSIPNDDIYWLGTEVHIEAGQQVTVTTRQEYNDYSNFYYTLTVQKIIPDWE